MIRKDDSFIFPDNLDVNLKYLDGSDFDDIFIHSEFISQISNLTWILEELFRITGGFCINISVDDYKRIETIAKKIYQVYKTHSKNEDDDISEVCSNGLESIKDMFPYIK